MTSETTSSRATWEESHRRTRELLGGLTAVDLDRPTGYPGWTVRGLAAHVATADAFTAMCVKSLARGKNVLPVPLPSGIVRWIGDRQNASAVKKHASDGVADLVAALDTSHANAAALLDGVPADGWDRSGKVPLLGTLTLATFLEQMAGHADEHAAELQRAVGRS